MSCDCESPILFECRTRTARKQHKCCECRRVISVGEMYFWSKGCWDGEFSEYKTCSDCKLLYIHLESTFEDWCPSFGGLFYEIDARLDDSISSAVAKGSYCNLYTEDPAIRRIGGRWRLAAQVAESVRV